MIFSVLAVLATVAKMLKKVKLPGPVGSISKHSVILFTGGYLTKMADLASEKLAEANEQAKAKNHEMTAMLTGFLLALEESEEDQVVLRSNR